MPVATTMAMSHQEGISDSARARELYKYYQPDGPINKEACFVAPAPILSTSLGNDDQGPNVTSSVTSSKKSSPDTALTAFCQLTVWRMGAQRAMLSVIDAETQYFIAESTKTVDLVDNTKHAPGDDIWMGCSSVAKAGRLCERTIEVKPTKPGDYPCFIVDDLTKDDRFNTLPFVTGSPNLKFYAGVPIITKRGIPIGSLFVVDSRPGLDIYRDKIHFMGTMAKTIMKHLEMTRAVEEHRRGMKMSRGLASFVEGRAELEEADMDGEDNEGTKIAGQFDEPAVSLSRTKSKDSKNASAIESAGSGSIERRELEYSAALAKAEIAIQGAQSSSALTQGTTTIRPERPEFGSGSQTASFVGTGQSALSPDDTHEKSSPGEDESEATSIRLLFSRSANLIREAFEVDGGCVFFDAQAGFTSNGSRDEQSRRTFISEETRNDSQAESLASSDDQVSAGEQHSDEEQQNEVPILLERTASPPGLGEGMFSRSTAYTGKPVEILGFSTADASSIHGDPVPGPHVFTPFGEKALHTLLRRYQRGKLWTFDSDGAVSSSAEEEPYRRSSQGQKRDDVRRRQVRNQKAKSDAKFLLKHFPGVRQLLFVPLWDASRSRWLAGCVAWSTEPTRILSKQSELAFLTAFGNSVMAEWARIDTEIANQKKGDFIGSISHELRSPLHGILNSAEFLMEEVSGGWETGLVEIIDSCGRTLLDTINHVLDYSKINHLEKNWKRTRKGGRPTNMPRAGSLSLQKSDLPMLNLFADVDIISLCEDVVESVFAGHIYQSNTAHDFDMVPGTRGKMPDPNNSVSSFMPSGQNPNSEVSVIVDVDLHDYKFTTQPGAFRRLVMNLLGNSLKYTSHGYVLIRLEVADLEDLPSGGSNGSGEPIPRAQVTLTVADTGKGISADFLRSKLFMPFAQENSLSSGTGLGLSIVNKIVRMCEGTIDIDSEVGRGTQVRVTLPLLRYMPEKATSATSTSTTKSILSAPRETDQLMVKLRSLVSGQKVALEGFDIDTVDPVIRDMSRQLKKSVTKFLVNWYGLRLAPFGQTPDIIICNEASPATIQSLSTQAYTLFKSTPSIIVLSSHSSRFDRNLSSASMCNVAFIAKPIGPHKLAKAILQCLDGDSTTVTPGPDVLSPATESTDLSNVFEEMTVGPHGFGGELLDNTRMAADSANARKAIESPTPNAIVEKHAEFPFPKADEKPSLPKSVSMPVDKAALQPLTNSTTQPASLTLASMENTKSNPAPKPSKAELKNPTLLLVDDNQINLRLLSTYTRRKYETVHEAHDGLEAVHMFEAAPAGYDVIFMDITMPILDGFGATKAIRALEAARNAKLPPHSEDFLTKWKEKGEKNDDGTAKEPPKPKGWQEALIIAFTGRSSSEDQKEAFRIGVDLFLTKPVAFKEVGMLLDNFCANDKREVLCLYGLR